MIENVRCSNNGRSRLARLHSGVSAAGLLLRAVLLAMMLKLAASQQSTAAATNATAAAARFLVNSLDLQNFKDHIRELSSVDGVTGGSRYWSDPGNDAALDYIQGQFEAFGYSLAPNSVERHSYLFQGESKQNVYATKVGTTRPDEVVIVSAHMDSVNSDSSDNSFAPGANDDASGTSLVLEAARVFGLSQVETEVSVRFVLWNNEETGLDGSRAYVDDRRSLQGGPDEPEWLAVIQHDQILWDHGFRGVAVAVDSQQNPDEADLDVEYAATSSRAGASAQLGEFLQRANARYALHYLAEVSGDMCCTDSVPFQEYCPSVSIRDNRRRAEIGQGSHPTWHRSSDVFETYSDLDFALGFDAVRTTVGAVAELVGALIVAKETASPSPSPTSSKPTRFPTRWPTLASTVGIVTPTRMPSTVPTAKATTLNPVMAPATRITNLPSRRATVAPSQSPSTKRSVAPTSHPSAATPAFSRPQLSSVAPTTTMIETNTTSIAPTAVVELAPPATPTTTQEQSSVAPTIIAAPPLASLPQSDGDLSAAAPSSCGSSSIRNGAVVAMAATIVSGIFSIADVRLFYVI